MSDHEQDYTVERPDDLWFVSEARYRRMWEVAARRQLDLAVVIENVHDQHNVSAVLRSCDAIGVGGVHLVYTEEQFPQLNKTISSSANLWLHIRRHQTIKECYAVLRSQGLRIYATALIETAYAPYALELAGPAAIVLGNEQRGVSQEALELADEAVYIPMQGMVQSFNISVAAAIVLSEAMRQRLAGGRYTLPTQLEQAHARILAAWLRREESRRRRVSDGFSGEE